MNSFYLYILTSKRNGTLYIAVTNELERRISEHKQKLVKGFTATYNVNLLMYFEEFKTAEEAFIREQQMKKWKRAWKLKLIEKDSPNWDDLSAEWYK